ncbi:uncharacterized protein LOC119666493 [Teleopsis dalmanni]|uniref:uncharacterized protein LOC119666493 n=1 Tax=Teleopsis dalmanni TaxID=139649 RepID=UPI0018CDDFB1|nr:uncharacterized protein LOC119666493 [Teleopsis dalmanni]
MLKMLKSNFELADLGSTVNKIRRTAKGELMLILKCGPEVDANKHKGNIAEVLHDFADIHVVSQQTTIECRDLDETTTVSDVCTAIRSQFPSIKSMKPEAVKVIRPSRYGTQNARIVLPTRDAKILINAGRIRIGWVVCRIGEFLQPTRCYKCLEFGHVSKYCKNDTNRACFRCGNTGHKAKSCDKTPRCLLCPADNNNHDMLNKICPVYQAACKNYIYMVKCLQINLNHCEVGQDLLMLTANDLTAEVLLISEPFNVPDWDGRWCRDLSGKAAIHICGQKSYEIIENNQHNGFVYAKIYDRHFYSCYVSPNDTIEDFNTMLDHLVENAKHKTPLVIAGDFNAWSTSWGSRCTNRRGFALLEAFASLDIFLLNDDINYTFDNGRFTSTIDLTFGSRSICKNSLWKVADVYRASDHKLIIFELTQDRISGKHESTRKAQASKWNTSKLDKAMVDLLADEIILTGSSANSKAASLMQSLKNICDASMPRRNERKHHRPAPWWNEEIGNLRTECHKLRRVQQRARGHNNFEQLNWHYKKKRKELRNSILQSKKRLYNTLLDELSTNPWGKAYQTVKKIMKGTSPPAPTNFRFLEEIVRNLFPQGSGITHILTDDDVQVNLITPS